MLKLNLGCGNKLYPASEGWVNVDVEAPEETVCTVSTIDALVDPDELNLPRFHQSLLQNLQFIDDDCVDEIHGYHIIEHFYRDEVNGVLKEWYRVLKPGGLIVLEQPDIIKCAANFLAGMVNGNDQQCYNLGFLGFYGDGTSEKPYMGHKWGWYGQTLATELENAGFAYVTQEPAQQHMKNMRDFRLEAYKGHPPK